MLLGDHQLVFLCGEQVEVDVVLLGPKCPTKPEDSGETWTSRDLQQQHLTPVSFPETETVVIF